MAGKPFLSEHVWLMLDRYGILLGDVLMTASVVAGIVAWFKRDTVRRWLRRNTFPEVGGVFAEEEMNWDGLVFTVSRQKVPEWVMQSVRPRAVALICSEQSRHAANALAKKAAEKGIRPLLTREVDADDPEQARKAVHEAITALRTEDCQHIAVDITGGKVPMSVGAFMGAEESGVESMYVSADYDRELKEPDMRTARILRISSGSA